MITYKSNSGDNYELTEEFFGSEIDDCIKYAIDEEGYELKNIKPEMIAEMFTDRENHGLSVNAMNIITDCIEKFEDFEVIISKMKSK